MDTTFSAAELVRTMLTLAIICTLKSDVTAALTGAAEFNLVCLTHKFLNACCVYSQQLHRHCAITQPDVLAYIVVPAADKSC